MVISGRDAQQNELIVKRYFRKARAEFGCWACVCVCPCLCVSLCLYLCICPGCCLGLRVHVFLVSVAVSMTVGGCG